MSQKIDFLKLDPDEVMRSMSVVEVESVAGRLQREVDSKREELRVMVGERYRDLIEAADTIQTMKSSAENIIHGVNSTLLSCGKIGIQLNSQPNTFTESSLSSQNQAYLSVAGSIQLLMTAPEKIWQAVDKQELTAAAQLYLISQHVYTGLQGDQGGGLSPQRIRQWFPVISRYYATINNFYAGIIKSANECLLTVDLDNEKALQALTALLFLQGLSCEDLLDTFLDLRRQCLENTISVGQSESARSWLCGYLRATICTVHTVARLFTQEQQLSRFVMSITDPNTAQPTFNLFDKAGLSKLYKFLPEPVLKYQTRLTKPFKNPDSLFVVQRMDDWVEASRVAGERQCDMLLKDIHTIHALSVVKQSVWSFLQNFEPYHHWDVSVKSVVSGETNLWESFFKSSVRRRVERIISDKISLLVEKLESSLKDGSSVDTLDVGEYIWQESSGDLNISSSTDYRISGTIHDQSFETNTLVGGGCRGLSLKCRGWSPAVKKICSELEDDLAVIWKEIVEAGKVDTTETGPFDRYCDHEQVKQHFRTTLTTSLASLVNNLKNIKELAEDNENASNSESKSKARSNHALYLARWLQSVPVLVSTLQLSLQSQENEYYFLVQLFQEASKEEFWIWVSSAIDTFSKDLSRFSLNEDPVAILPAWDTVEIQESSESDSMKSKIRLPGCPSTQLITALHSLAVNLHSSHPATIPADILLRISRKVLEMLVSHLNSLVSDHLTQNIALQLYFNLKFVQFLFLSRQFKDELAQPIIDLESRINANIDPFDQSVFSEHITSRLKRTCAREFSSLCPLIPQDRAEIISGLKTSFSSSSSQDVSNMMNLNPSPPSRFQLLPTATSSGGPGHLGYVGPAKSLQINKSTSSARSPRTPNLDRPNNSGKTLDVKKPAATSSSGRKRDRSPVAATAASFFGSMGSSWFGGGNSGGASNS